MSFAKTTYETGQEKDWTVEEALEAALAEIRSGEIAPTECFIVMRGNLDDRRIAMWWKMAGVTTKELTAMLWQMIFSISHQRWG